MDNRIPVARPVIADSTRKYVLDCLDTTWISSVGSYIDRFEKDFASFCGVKHAISCNNGTTALHLALIAAGISRNDEVIIPNVTYIATANCVSYCGAKPVFVDCDSQTYNIDPSKLEEKITSKTKAIIVVHLYGHSCDMDEILKISEKYNIPVIEDAAEAHGARYKGKRVGGFGLCASFSFFGNKIITTGEGGAVVTNDDEVASRLRLFKSQGVDPKRRYWHTVIGYNYRMTNIAAAIGCSQLERIDEALLARKQLASWYDEALFGIESISLPITEDWAEHVYWMYTISIKRELGISRDLVIERLDDLGIETRPVFYPMHMLPPYEHPNEYANSENCALYGINLPTHEFVTKEDVLRIKDALLDSLS